MWHASEDVFTFVSHITEQECEWTKRMFFSRIATLFDPLGLMVPFLIRAKILMQEVWLHGLEWDARSVVTWLGMGCKKCGYMAWNGMKDCHKNCLLR